MLPAATKASGDPRRAGPGWAARRILGKALLLCHRDINVSGLLTACVGNVNIWLQQGDADEGGKLCTQWEGSFAAAPGWSQAHSTLWEKQRAQGHAAIQGRTLLLQWSRHLLDASAAFWGPGRVKKPWKCSTGGTLEGWGNCSGRYGGCSQRRFWPWCVCIQAAASLQGMGGISG